MISFKTQFDKLTAAYINNEVDPNCNCACFVGNLLNRKPEWGGVRNIDISQDFMLESIKSSWRGMTFYEEAVLHIIQESDNTYTSEEIVALENIFLKTLYKLIPLEVRRKVLGLLPSSLSKRYLHEHPAYEDALFTAFQAALDKLREIHISKGENVDEFVFTKRKLELA
jgi:hypothetical protein